MGQQQMNQLNSMHMMMNGHAMMNMQQHQGMMHQQNMMSPMSQINPTQFSTQQPPHPPQPPQQQAVLLVSNLNSEVFWTHFEKLMIFGFVENHVLRLVHFVWRLWQCGTREDFVQQERQCPVANERHPTGIRVVFKVFFVEINSCNDPNETVGDGNELFEG